MLDADTPDAVEPPTAVSIEEEESAAKAVEGARVSPRPATTPRESMVDTTRRM